MLVAIIHGQFQRFFSQHQGVLAKFPPVEPLFAAAHWTEASILSTIVVYAAIRIAMWLWMASRNNAGGSWARILSAVLLGLYTPVLIADLARGLRFHAYISLGILQVAIWLVGVCAIALLWRRKSSEFFTARSKRQ